MDRERERAILHDLLEDARAGRARTLLLVGDAGVGKSALLAETGSLAQASGARVVRARAVESERTIPGASISLLVTGLADLLDEVETSCAATLRATLRGVVGPRLPGATLHLLGRAAEDSVVLLLGDDIQWWDDPSLEALLFATRRLADDDVAVLLAGRPSTRLATTLEPVPRLVLGPLGVEASVALLQRTDPDLGSEVAWNLAVALGGNPLALLETPALLPGRVRTGAVPLPDPVPVGAVLGRRWARVLDELPMGTRLALAVLAADDTGCADCTDTAWETSGCGRDDLVPAEARQVVVLDRHGWEFRSPLVRAAVYAALTPPERRAAHAALATALAGRGRDALYARHLSEATLGPDPTAADELGRLASSLALEGSPLAAAAAAEQAARLTPPGSGHGQRLLEASSLALLAGDDERAVALAEQALPLSPDPVTTARLNRVLGDAVGRQRDTRRGVALLRTAAAALDEPERAEALVDALGVAALGDDPEAEEQIVREIGDLERLEPPLQLEVGVALADRGSWAEALPLLDRGLRLVDPTAPGLGEHLVEAWAHGAAVLGLDTMADRYRWTARALCDSGSPATSGSGLAMEAELAYAEGRWSDAEQLSAELRRLTAALGRHPLASLRIDLRLAAARGDREWFDVGESRLRTAASHPGLDTVRRHAVGLRGLLLVSIGRDEEAEPLLRRAVEESSPGLLITGAGPTAAVLLASTCARTGRPAEAHDVADLVVGRLLAQPSRLAHAYAERLLAHTACGSEAEDHLRAATGLADGAMDAFAAACTRVEHAQWLRRRRRRADAVELLTPALTAFRSLGCAPWAQRCGEELRAAGVDVRRAHPQDEAPRLTAQERRIADAAAAGLTNAAIAHRMYLSPKTVEVHLTHCYRKLGISGRSELADALQPTAGVS